MSVQKSISILKLWIFLFYSANHGRAETSDFTTNVSEISSAIPCPCDGQPAGIVIPHPSDCRAYYTCVGGSSVLLSKCPNPGEFFHPYIRSCVQRSAQFSPNFIPTKDICKITAVFPAPAMENFDNCTIKYDETFTNDANSDEMLPMTNSKVIKTPSSEIPGFEKILSLFPWTSNRKGVPESNGSDLIQTASSSRTTEMPTEQITNTNKTSSTPSIAYTSNGSHCKLLRVIIHHFPGPCKADITCESGTRFTIDNCQSSLNLVQM